eukprot:jgi/Hompol1/4716/HPOL_003848-RA
MADVAHADQTDNADHTDHTGQTRSPPLAPTTAADPLQPQPLEMLALRDSSNFASILSEIASGIRLEKSLNNENALQDPIAMAVEAGEAIKMQDQPIAGQEELTEQEEAVAQEETVEPEDETGSVVEHDSVEIMTSVTASSVALYGNNGISNTTEVAVCSPPKQSDAVVDGEPTNTDIISVSDLTAQQDPAKDLAQDAAQDPPTSLTAASREQSKVLALINGAKSLVVAIRNDIARRSPLRILIALWLFPFAAFFMLILSPMLVWLLPAYYFTPLNAKQFVIRKIQSVASLIDSAI